VLQSFHGIIRVNKNVHFSHTKVVPIEANVRLQIKVILKPTNGIESALGLLAKIELKDYLI